MKNIGSQVILFLKSPLARISFGLVMLTVSLLLIADLLGLMPDSRGNEVAFRQHIAQSAAVQISMEISERDPTKLKQILSSTVARNDHVLGIAVRSITGIVQHDAGLHATQWRLAPTAESSVEQVRIALHSSKGQWGDLEIVFKPMPIGISLFRGGSAVLKIVLYVALAGFIGYYFFLKKVMRELDPDQVIPDRIRSALDSLADGLMIINSDGIVMFCNHALAKRIGINARNLTGKECASLDWVMAEENAVLPWETILSGSRVECEQTVNLRVGQHQNYQFIVNASAIIGEREDVRGVMIAFNDITELEKKNTELSKTLANLEETQTEIEKKNRELFTMATRDPLTNLFNRRAFFDAFDTHFEQALSNNTRLGCIMLDIDHFKSVNDTHGHGVGDEVIVYLADTLTAFLGDIDVVGRFGGEEFCMLMPAATVEAASQRAEKIRKHIEQGIDANFSVKLSITSSFGVACMPCGARNPSELVEYADLALYEAKSTGRNRVVCWQSNAGRKQETGHSRDVIKDSSASSEEAVVQSTSTVSRDVPADSPEFNNARGTERRRELANGAPGAMVLVEPGRALTHRQLLAANIDTAIRRAQRESHIVAVVVLDGSTLQHIANNVDFNMGNKLCSVLVDRMKNVLRLADVVSQAPVVKVSGAVTQIEHNELAVLLTDIDAKESIAGIVERLLAVFDQRIVMDGLEYVVDTKAGVSVLGEDGNSADALLQNACVACSNAQLHETRNAYSFYSPQMDEAAKRYIRLQTSLYRAIEKHELEVFYQPKMDLISGDIVGFEALLRWHHPNFGLIPPNEFIPMAEKSGLIHPLNRWVMTEVVDQIKRWQQSGHSVDSVAVNISALELRDPEFSNRVIDIVNAAKMPPSVLEIEITESIGIEEVDIARNNLENLHKAGMPISVDDFGTGYASLGYLQHFPITRLKIDRIFVTGCTTDEKKARVVRSIITMGNSLGMRVLAEGVETKEQLLFLRDHHCDEIQGFFVSKPLDAEQTSERLEKPSKLSQIVLKATIGTEEVSSTTTTMPTTGFDAIVSRFPGAAIDQKEVQDKSDQAAG